MRSAIQTPDAGVDLAAQTGWCTRNRSIGFFERLGSPVKEKACSQGFYHDTLGEKDRAPADRARCGHFWCACLLSRQLARRLFDADQHGFTQDEFRPAEPPPSPSPRGRIALHTGMLTGGRLGRLEWRAWVG